MGGDYDTMDNHRLVTALMAGDGSAFEAVYTAYARPLRHYAASILRDEEAAFEVVQDVFVAVWMHRRRLDASKSLRNYLLRAVHNNSLRLIRADEARRRREGRAAASAFAAAGAEAHPHWAEELPPPALERLAPAVSRLPEQSRKVLRMSYWENKKHAAIAEELSISVRTVETILYKVVKKLRGELKK